MKTIEVVAAVRRLPSGLVWVCRRSEDGAHAGLRGMWEYPGGKVESGESLRDALVREMLEEFGVTATVGSLLDTIDSPYGEVTYRVHFFDVVMPEPAFLRCHTVATWMTPAEALALDHLPSGAAFNRKHLAA